ALAWDCDTLKTPKCTQYIWTPLPLPWPWTQIGTTIVQPVQLSKPSVVVQASLRTTSLRTGPAWTPVSDCHQPGTATLVEPSVRPLKLLLPAPQSGTWGPWIPYVWPTAAGFTTQELPEASSSGGSKPPWAASRPQIMNGDEPARSASIWAVAEAEAENPLMPRALMKLPLWLSRARTDTPATAAGRPAPVLAVGQSPRSPPAWSTRRQSGEPLTLLAASEATTAL